MNDAMVNNMDTDELIREAEARGMYNNPLFAQILDALQGASEWAEISGERKDQYDAVRKQYDVVREKLNKSYRVILFHKAEADKLRDDILVVIRQGYPLDGPAIMCLLDQYVGATRLKTDVVSVTPETWGNPAR